jgi:hypothetical protein
LSLLDDCLYALQPTIPHLTFFVIASVFAEARHSGYCGARNAPIVAGDAAGSAQRMRNS